MYEEELNILLNSKWTEEEKSIISRLTDNLMYYKKLVPSSLKKDIFITLQLCNKLKTEFEEYKDMKVCSCHGLKINQDINDKEIMKEIE
jgi:hypothetical protein